LPHVPRLDTDSRRLLTALGHAFWAACGAIVLLFIIVGALGAVEPSEAPEVTIPVLALAVLWFGHAWRELWRDERR
jgi:hypothetical protein